MATTTPNYGWPVPTSTDLVKDGATAIEALGDAIDATVYAQTPGLSLISTTTFSAVSSVSLATNSFTATFTNYKIVLNTTYSTSTTCRMRLRAAGADDTANSYISQTIFGNSTTLSGTRVTATSYELQQFSTDQINGQIDIFNPKATALTRITHQFSGAQTNNEMLMIGNGLFNVTTSFDSITLFPVTGTMTGSLSIYGYSK